MQSLLTPKQVAKILNVPLQTIYYWNSQRKLPFIKLHGKLVRYDPKDIKAFIQGRRVK